MSYLDTWREQVPNAINTFKSLISKAPGINRQYGILAAALLYPIQRALVDNKQVHDAVEEVFGDSADLVLKTIAEWNDDPLNIAKSLSISAIESDELQKALDRLLKYFKPELETSGLIQTTSIHIQGDISGYIVNIGGNQFFYGDVFITVVQTTVYACPTAPVPPPHFTGRETQLRMLHEQLARSDVVTITAVKALGGMGKTALAKAFAHQPENGFRAVLWAEITEHPQLFSQLLSWGRYASHTFTLPPDTPLETMADNVRALLTELIKQHCGGRTLVIFDDVWESDLCYQAVELLRRAAPDGAQVLITTRQEQVVQRFQGRSLELPELPDEEAKALLKKLITNPVVTEIHIVRAVTILRGHPLALELAAASLNLAEREVSHIDDILNDYERGVRDGSPFDAMPKEGQTPHSLNVVFGRSYNELSKDLQAKFRILGVLAPDVTWNRSLAAAIWQEDNEKMLRQSHADLRNRELIKDDDELNQRNGEKWYRQHPLLRAYARALLAKEIESNTGSVDLYARYTEHIIKFVTETFEQKVDQRYVNQWYLPHIRYIGNNLLEKMRQILGKLDPFMEPKPLLSSLAEQLSSHLTVHRKTFVMASQFAHAVFELVFDQLEIGEIGRQWLSLGLIAERTLHNQSQISFFLNELGAWYGNRSQPTKALVYHRYALRTVRRLNEPKIRADALHNIGRTYYDLGRLDRTLRLYELALPVWSEAADQMGEAITRNSMGVVYHDNGNLKLAQEYYEQALKIRQEKEPENFEAQGISFHNIGDLYRSKGELELSLKHFFQALQLLRRGGNKAEQARTVVSIGAVYRDAAKQAPNAILLDKSGAFDSEKLRRKYQHKALFSLRLAKSILHRLGDTIDEANAVNKIGLLLRDMGQPVAAVQQLDIALQMHRSIKDKLGEVRTLNIIGLSYMDMREFETAVDFFKQALSVIYGVNVPSEAAHVLRNLSEAYTKLSQLNVEQSLQMLESNNLSQSAGGTTVEQLRDGLEELQQFLAVISPKPRI